MPAANSAGPLISTTWPVAASRLAMVGSASTTARTSAATLSRSAFDMVPFGYELKEGQLLIVEKEAQQVRTIFRRYLELGSVNRLVVDLRERNFRSKVRKLSTGGTRGGVAFTQGPLFYILRNRFYVGEVRYRNEICPGAQPPLMDRKLFEAVQTKLTEQWSHRTVTRTKGAKRKTPSIAPDLKALFERALSKKVKLRQGERENIVTKAEVGIEQLVNQFAKGDRHARRDVMTIADKLGVDLVASQRKAIEEERASNQRKLDALTDDELRELERLLQKMNDTGPNNG